MFGLITNYENKLFISGQEIVGVEDVNISYSNTNTINRFIGYSVGTSTIGGATQQKMTIARNLIYVDPLLAYTGNSVISGSVNYNNNSYGFKSGYMEQYMVNCAVGSVPKVTVNMSIYDELLTGAINNASGSVSTPTIYIPNQGSISLTCDNSTTNRVVGFDYSIKATQKPIYTIGSKLPIDVVYLSPLEFSATVQVEVDDAFLSSGMAFLTARANKTVTFSIAGRTGNLLQTLTIPKASLVGESLSSTAEGGVKITLNYIGHQ